MFNVETKNLGSFDVAVCGGGIAGVCAAVSAARNGAKTVLIESAGSLGGTLTEGQMPYILDGDNKGGMIQEMLNYLNAREQTIAKRGRKLDENGRRIPGYLINVEGAKYFFDEVCRDAGVKVLFHSRVAAAGHVDGHIRSVMLATECGNYSLEAKVYIDATGNGSLAALVGCRWECGDPVEGRPSPASMQAAAVGMPDDYDGIQSVDDKTEYANMLLKHNISISSQQASVVKLPALKLWGFGMNFQYDVMPDDIESLSNAEAESRKEIFEVMDAHRKIPGYEQLYLILTGAHIGIREGRRIFGQYRLTDEDIIEGRRFEDGICLVTFGVDVHKLKSDDTLDCSRGIRTKPYHIPYRCLVPLDSDNILLAGRCISGDFYPHASYRVMGNMAGTGEAAGFAAAICAREGIKPCEVDGKKVGQYMKPYLNEPAK